MPVGTGGGVGLVGVGDAHQHPVAVLDVDLNGKDAYPAADVLEDRGIPFVFHTGHGTKRELRASYPTAPVIKKPTPPEEIITQLAKLV